MNLLLLCIAIGSLFFLKLPMTATEEEVATAKENLSECQFKELSDADLNSLPAREVEGYHQKKKICTEAIVNYIKKAREEAEKTQ